MYCHYCTHHFCHVVYLALFMERIELIYEYRIEVIGWDLTTIEDPHSLREEAVAQGALMLSAHSQHCCQRVNMNQ